MRLYGRDAELAALSDVLDQARGGASASRVLRGDPGIGKTALVGEVIARADGFRVIRGAGIEEESGLPFAGLHLLLRPALDRIPVLPEVQAEALRGALGLARAVAPDRFLVGLAVLSLLAELAADQPLLCVVDDAQWLDRASADALLFAARRLDSESVVLLLCARAGAFPAAGLADVPLTGLSAEAATALLPDDLPAPRRYRVLAEAAGNPLALLELPRVLADGQPESPLPLPLTDRLRAAFESRLDGLPEPTRTALLAAAAEGTGDLAAIVRAVGTLGVSLADLDPALAAGLLEVTGGSLRFSHPLIRAAVHHSAPLGRRQAVHLALAAALDGPGQAGRRAWQQAAAAAGPDEEIAAALERAAGRVRERGGDGGALPWYQRAAELSADPAGKARRLSLAADAAAGAGDLDQAAALAAESLHVTTAEGPGSLGAEGRGAAADGRPGVAADEGLNGGAGPRLAAGERLGLVGEIPGAADANGLGVDTAGPALGQAETAAEALQAQADTRARALQAQATVAFLRGDPAAAHRRLLDASGLIAADDREQASALLIEAAHAGWYTGRDELAEAVTRLEKLQPRPAAVERLLLRAVVPILGRTADGSDPDRALAEARSAAAGNAPGLVLVCGLALLLGHDLAAQQIGDELSRELRAAGQIGWLPTALFYAGSAQAYGGRHAEAAQTVAEGVRLARDTGQQRWVEALAEPLALLAAARGDERACRQLADVALAGASRPAWSVPWTSSSLGLLDLGLGRAESALARLETLAEGRRFFHIPATRSTPDLVEAAVRVGRPEAAAEPLALYEAWARNTGQAWTTALGQRCQALLGGGEDLFLAALALHEQDSRPFDEARTRLLYGEWLRREKRKSDARGQLRRAVEEFERIGAVPWAERARTELTATGLAGAVRAGHDGRPAGLTPQELQIVRLAALGLSNKDIAAQLFLSARTVGHHLYKAYPKLGVVSRAGLADLNLG